MGIPALARRRYPLWAFAATAALLAAHWAPSGFDTAELLPADLALLVVLAAVTEHCSGPRAAAAAAVCEMFALATLLGSIEPATQQPVVPLTALVLVAAMTGRNLRARAAVLAALRERAERAEHDRDQQAQIAVAEERVRIAREVHDVVSHSVSVMTALADGAGYALGSGSDRPQVRHAVTTIATTGREALRELQGVLGVLRSGHGSAEEDYSSLRPAPGLGDLEALVEQVQSTGLRISLAVVGRPAPLSGAAQLAVYRLVQEALTNTRKHAQGATRATVLLTWAADALAVVVRDDGHGGSPVPDAACHGLIGMRERMTAHGGTVTAGPCPTGWCVEAALPVFAALARR